MISLFFFISYNTEVAVWYIETEKLTLVSMCEKQRNLWGNLENWQRPIPSKAKSLFGPGDGGLKRM